MKLDVKDINFGNVDYADVHGKDMTISTLILAGSFDLLQQILAWQAASRSLLLLRFLCSTIKGQWRWRIK